MASIGIEIAVMNVWPSDKIVITSGLEHGWLKKSSYRSKLCYILAIFFVCVLSAYHNLYQHKFEIKILVKIKFIYTSVRRPIRTHLEIEEKNHWKWIHSSNSRHLIWVQIWNYYLWCLRIQMTVKWRKQQSVS